MNPSQADVCVIFNPTAGKNRAAQRLENLRGTWGPRITFLPTKGPGHAVELARTAATAGYRIVTAAGGDGTVHEVANGLLQAQRPDVHFAVIPLGSANDFAYSVGLEHAADPSHPLVRSVDVGLIRTPCGRERHFLCCLGLGFNGAVTLESRKIEGLQGVALYGLATLRALKHHFRCPSMEVVIDAEPPRCMPTLMLSVLLGRREGGFVLAPDAQLADGWFDFVHCGNLSRWDILRYLPRLALFGPPSHDPKIRQGRCRYLRVHSPKALIIHVDGEFFSRPEDDDRQVEIRILPAALKVQMSLDTSEGPL